MVKCIESHNLIVKSNHLIEANYRLSKYEQKILYRLMMSIDKDDEDFKSYIFSVDEFTKLLNIKDKSSYKKIQKYTKDLQKKVLEIYDVNLKELTQVSWLSSAKYSYGKGTVALKFDPELKPFLLQLKKSFTQIDGRIAIQLKSGFSIRINELLQQYINVGERIITVEDLRKKLGILDTEYTLYSNLKQRVILQAQKEINNHPELDLWFDFKEIKTGRSVTAIKFIIKRKFVKNSKDNCKVDIDLELVENFINKFNDQNNTNLAGTEKTKELVIDLMQEKGFEHFEECFKKFPQVIVAEARKGHIRSLEGLFMNFVKHGYNFNTNMLGQVGHEVNFEQREYTEEDFEKFYFKVE
jgi:plasmid replication initiation protein